MPGLDHGNPLLRLRLDHRFLARGRGSATPGGSTPAAAVCSGPTALPGGSANSAVGDEVGA